MAKKVEAYIKLQVPAGQANHRRSSKPKPEPKRKIKAKQSTQKVRIPKRQKERKIVRMGAAIDERAVSPSSGIEYQLMFSSSGSVSGSGCPFISQRTKNRAHTTHTMHKPSPVLCASCRPAVPTLAEH